jgi:hypothetical protein
MHRCLLFLVLVVHICASLFNEKLDCLIFTTSDCVVEGRLSILIDWVWIRLVNLDKSPHNLKMALPASIEEWCLHIWVGMVHLASLFNKDLNQIQFTLSTGIVQCCLIKRIDGGCINTIWNKIFNHLDAFSFFFYQASIENGVVIVLLIMEEW